MPSLAFINLLSVGDLPESHFNAFLKVVSSIIATGLVWSPLGETYEPNMLFKTLRTLMLGEIFSGLCKTHFKLFEL